MIMLGKLAKPMEARGGSRRRSKDTNYLNEVN